MTTPENERLLAAWRREYGQSFKAVENAVREAERERLVLAYGGSASVAAIKAEERERAAADVRECQADVAPDTDAWHRLGEAADYILRGWTP
jgi:hypothetical protein